MKVIRFESNRRFVSIRLIPSKKVRIIKTLVARSLTILKRLRRADLFDQGNAWFTPAMRSAELVQSARHSPQRR
jgi:hypothetical protein